MKPLTVIALSACLLAAPARNVGGQSSFTGTDWRGWSTDLRLMYLVGWVDGWGNGVHVATKEFAPDLAADWPHNARVAKLASAVTVGQLLQGMNKFYEDYPNVQISVRLALEIVDDESSGRRHWSDEEIRRIRATESRPKPPQP